MGRGGGGGEGGGGGGGGSEWFHQFRAFTGVHCRLIGQTAQAAVDQ